jgi:hypothetical protein
VLLSSDDKKSEQQDLPLETAEQIAHSEAVDGALERRSKRTRHEIGTRTVQFRSLAEKITFIIGLLFAVALFCCALDLWMTGETARALMSFGASGGLGGGNWMLLRRKRSDDPW